MASTQLDYLLDEADKAQPGLKARIQHELARRTQQFGLVFERHLPETVQLPGRAISTDDIVQILPERGSTAPADPTLWHVADITGHADDPTSTATLVACDTGGADIHSADVDNAQPQTTTAQLDDLVAVALHDDRIYPGLRLDARVSHPDAAPDAPVHAVINAENSHALKMLTYTHYHSIDCIYIDPPYNTGARDWKYNNNYVDGDDAYRHSKWLTFMERRLKLAKKLLNPDDAVLIVTIDEKEYLRLGMLLEQTFPEARIQMVSSVIARKGSNRSDSFGRANEYLFILMFGDAKIARLPLSSNWYLSDDSYKTEKLVWQLFRRGGTSKSSYRANSPGCFYPVYLTKTESGEGVIHSIGDAIPLDQEPFYELPDGADTVVWPFTSDGDDGCYQVSPENARLLVKNGYLRVGRWAGNSTSLSYLKRGNREKIDNGDIAIVGRRTDGSVIEAKNGGIRKIVPTDNWNIPSHDATYNGSKIIKALLGESRFTFPKSLYAVEDALRFFVKDKPDAVILDFFAGSGTTTHAVMRLNQEDDGRRQSISVTNNEVSDDEEKALTKQGLRPSDPTWQALGIANHVTFPRVKAAITGKTATSDYTQPIKGKYAYNREAPMADGIPAHAALFTLTYENPLLIQHDMAFDTIAPLLWLRAGQRGEIITADMLQQQWAVTPYYGVIQDQAQASRFVAALAQSHSTVTTVFIITDDELLFQSTAQAVAKVNPTIDTVQMYSTYLDNFTFQDN